MNIEDLPGLGFTILYETTQRAPDFAGHLAKGKPLLMTQRFVVARKDLPCPPAAPRR